MPPPKTEAELPLKVLLVTVTAGVLAQVAPLVLL